MPVSLCESCANVREVRTARSRFFLCELSRADVNYPKYPPQPVVQCAGYQRKDDEKGDKLGEAPGRDS
jgi:hypothetical protein